MLRWLQACGEGGTVQQLQYTAWITVDVASSMHSGTESVLRLEVLTVNTYD